LTTYFSQGSVATDSTGGGSFHFPFSSAAHFEFNGEKVMKIGRSLPKLS